MSIQNVTTDLRLRFGVDAARTIVVPIDVRKGSYPGRYELYVDGIHVGWVVRYDGQTARRAYTVWDAYLVAEQNYGTQEKVASHKTRHEAIKQFAWYLGKAARGNVLAARAELAYAE